MSRQGARQARTRLVLAPVALAVLVLAGAGCGGDDEPAYCSSLNDLEESVRSLGDVDVVAGGTNAVRNALSEVETSANSTVDAAKSDFPDETSAISESISNLKASAQQLADSPTAAEAGDVAVDVSAVVTSVDNFADATSGECD
jgi:hypothetical protein